MATHTLESIKRKLGPRLDEIVRRIKAGESRKALAKELGINPRHLTDLNPLVYDTTSETATAAIQKAVTDDPRATLNKVRGMVNRKMGIEERVNRMVALARNKDNPSVSAKMLERLDKIAGINPSETTLEPDPPPLFALPWDAVPAFMRIDDWRRNGEKGPEIPPPTSRARTGGGGGAVGGSGGATQGEGEG